MNKLKIKFIFFMFSMVYKQVLKIQKIYIVKIDSITYIIIWTNFKVIQLRLHYNVIDVRMFSSKLICLNRFFFSLIDLTIVMFYLF